MGQPLVHFEIIAKDPAKLRGYLGELFGWEFDTSSPVAEAVSEPMNYDFVYRITTSDRGRDPRWCRGARATRATWSFTSAFLTLRPPCRRPSPERAPAGLVAGHFTDREGNLIGVAGPA